MKEHKLYTCEICHTDYNDKAKAIECEKNHKTITSCVPVRYKPKSVNQTGRPESVKVTFNDGSSAEYKQ